MSLPVVLILTFLVIPETVKSFQSLQEIEVLYQAASGVIRESHLFCDSFGRVLAAWISNDSTSEALIPGTSSIWFAVKSGDEDWTQPIDLTYGDDRFPNLLVTQDGVTHLFFANGNCLHEMQSDYSLSGSIEGWKRQDCLASADGMILFIDSVEGANGVIYVAFTSDKGTVHFQKIDPQDVVLPFPITIASQPGGIVIADSVHLAIDSTGRIHAVWSGSQQGAELAAGVFYSRSEDGGATWTAARMLAGEGNLEPNLATIGENVIDLVWNTNVRFSRRYFARSRDGGATWSDPEEIGAVQGGVLGSPGIAVDSYKTTHVLMNTDVGALYNSHLWSNIWTGPRFWIEESQVFQANACISKGNQFWGIFDEGKTKKVWVGSLTTGSPEIPAQTPPQISILSMSVPEAAANPEAEAAQPTKITYDFEPELKERSNPQRQLGLPLLIPVISVAAVVLIAILVQARKRIR